MSRYGDNNRLKSISADIPLARLTGSAYLMIEGSEEPTGLDDEDWLPTSGQKLLHFATMRDAGMRTKAIHVGRRAKLKDMQ